MVKNADLGRNLCDTKASIVGQICDDVCMKHDIASRHILLPVFLFFVENKEGVDCYFISGLLLVERFEPLSVPTSSGRSGIIIFDLVFPYSANSSLLFPLKSSSSWLHLLPGLPGLLYLNWRINTCQPLRSFNHYN
jgi:hypothetical protein